MSAQNEIRQKITDQILAALSDGTKLPPWRKSWHCYDANIGQPCNALTGKSYRGINTLALGLSAQQRGFQSRHWLTFRLWLAGMKNDTRFIFRAAAQASRAVDHILSYSATQEEAPENEEALVA